MMFLKKIKIVFLMTILIIIVNCKNKLELYRIIDHTNEENIIESPFKKIHERFKKCEQNLNGKWIYFPEFSTSKNSIWGISTKFPILGLYDTENPPGMKVFMKGQELSFSKDLEYKLNSWKWIKCEKNVINEVNSLSLNEFLTRDIILPQGTVFFEIGANSMSPKDYLPNLKLELNGKIIGLIKIGKWKWHRISAKATLGKHELKLTFSDATKVSRMQDREMKLRLSHINIRCFKDIILISTSKEASVPDETYKAVFYKDPKKQKNKNSSLNYSYAIFESKYKKQFMLHDLGIEYNPYFIKKKLIINDKSINTIMAPPRTEYKYALKIPEDALLEFGYGILSNPREREQNNVIFKVFIETSKKKSLLFSKQLNYEEKDERKIFFQKIDLNPFKQKKAKLYFIADFAPIKKGEKEKNIKCNIAYWYNPVIFKKIEKSNKKLEENINIILISLDTLRADHLGCYGYFRDTSPNIDKFAEDSVLFANCFSQAPHTITSHMSMLTSLYPAEHQVYTAKNMLIPSIVTLSDILRKNNYFTIAYTGGGKVSSKFGFSKGFDFYYEDKKNYYKRDSAHVLFKKTAGWLSNNRAKKSFLFLHTYEIHDPYAPPEQFSKKFYFKKNMRKKAYMFEILDKQRGKYKALTEEEKQNIIALYDGEIRYTDEYFIGPLINILKELNLYDRSLIIITSDHGEEFAEHGGWGHSHSLYNEVIHVPLIIKFPYSKYKGKRINNIIRIIDIMPTILEETKIDFSRYKMDGITLINILKGKEKGDRTFFSEIKDIGIFPDRLATNQNKYKFILNREIPKKFSSFFYPPPPPNDEIELFNLENDRFEKINIVQKEKNIVNKLLQDVIKYTQKGKMNKQRTEKPIIDKKLKEKLKALGYVH